MRGFVIAMKACAILLYSAALAVAGAPNVVDRVAVTVGNRAITTSHIDDEIRLTAFMKGEPPKFDPAERRAAAGRLVERLLLQREMEITHYTSANSADTAADTLADLRGRYLDEKGFTAALAAAQISIAKIEDYLDAQARMLLFIDFRFRPAVTISEADARAFYDNEYPAFWAVLHPDQPKPDFDEARDDVDRLLTDRKVDAEMDSWLTTARAQTRVNYHDEAFQ